jgi:2-polyprenyl-6-methoxyphenol hydroxylase-like FAD-dependent oxidoreductase
VRGLGNVEIIDQTDILGLTTTADRGRVTGARVQARDGDTEQTIEADLVIDATGRGSRTGRWLEELGYPRVAEEKVIMDLAYTTANFKGPLAVDPLGDDIGIIPVATPANPRGAIFGRMPDAYAVSLTGILGDRPPTDIDGFLAYTKSLIVPEIYEAVRDAEPIGEPAAFRFPASIRRHYERLSRFPQGLLLIGDSFCIFNPVYGQGMTISAMEALVLGRHLAQGKEPVPQEYHRDLKRLIDAPWDMSAGADLGFPGVQGKRTHKVFLGIAYNPRLQAAAVHDGRLTSAFLHAAGLVNPPQSLMTPRVMARVFRAGAGRGQHAG